jgi:hypothetical protein
MTNYFDLIDILDDDFDDDVLIDHILLGFRTDSHKFCDSFDDDTFHELQTHLTVTSGKDLI